MPPVFGFHSAQPVAQIYRHPFTSAVIATPVLDLSSVRGPQGYADRSGTGANGAPVGAPANARGVFDEAIKFGGLRDALNCGSNAHLNITGAITLAAWVNQDTLRTSDVVFGKMSATGGFAGYALRLNLVLEFWSSSTGLWRVGNMVIPAKRATHVGVAAADSVVRLFVDGLQDARAAWVGQGNNAAEVLMISGYSTDITNAFNGLIELPQVYNGALSPEQVYRKYLEAREVPIYLDDFSSYAVTPVAKAVGSMCGPFRVLAGAMTVVADAAGKKWVQGSAVAINEAASGIVADQAYGTWEFDLDKVSNANECYFEFACSSPAVRTDPSQNGYLFWADGAGNAKLNAITAGAMVNIIWLDNVGTSFFGAGRSIRIVRRVGGQFTVYIKGGPWPDWALMPPSFFSNPGVNNTHTTGKYIGVGLMSTGVPAASDKVSNIRQSLVCERPASFPWEFSTGTYAGLVSGSTIWMRCLTAGVTYLPKDLDWQTCIFKLYKGADANVTDILFVASEIGGTTFANQNGYVLRLAADESVQLIRTSGGIEAAPTAQTAAGYVAITTEYEFKITHNGTTNAYEFYIMGGAYATWTLMFAATLGIHTSSNFTIWDLDASDRATAPAFYADLR